MYVWVTNLEKTALDVFEDTITTGTDNTPLTFTNVSSGKEIAIINDSVDNDLQVRFDNSDTREITVKGGEAVDKTTFTFTTVDISNNSGGSIDYRIWVSGT